MAKLPKNFRITSDGKVVKATPRKNGSQKIADRKRPKRKFVRVTS